MPVPVLSVRVRLGDTVTELQALEDKLADLRPFFEGPADELVRAMWKEMFATEGKSIGHAWAELAPRTLKAKARANRENMGVLQFSRSLYQSLVSRSDAEGVKVVDKRSATFGTRVPYARRHQLGGGHLPQRRLVPEELPDAVEQDLRTKLVAYLTTGAV